VLGDALSEVLGDSLGEADGEALGDSLGEADGEALGDSLGEAEADVLGELDDSASVYRSAAKLGEPACVTLTSR